jgi:Tol biopolymer transport system component
MKAKRTIIFSWFCVINLISFAQNKSIDYFGQTPPGDSAVIFAPGIISLPNRSECRIVFSPSGNECIFNVWATDYSSAKIYYTKCENNIWTPQVEAPFSIGHMASGPFLSSDGNRLYFHYANYKGPEPYNIWMVERTSQGWSDPMHLPAPINSNNRDGAYSETNDGIVYFTSNRPDGLDKKGDIWCTRKVPGQPLQVENLGVTVNSSSWDASPCIAPDESYLIFVSERPGGYGYSDLYITYKKEDGSWTIPFNMELTGAGINLKKTATGDASLSPDGRFLFFSRNGDIYWVSTKVIKDIKIEVFNQKNSK